MTVQWGFIGDNQAELLVPGDVAGDGRLEANQFGIGAEDAVIYGSLADLRALLEKILRHLPADRDGADLVVVDAARQEKWLLGVEDLDDPDWEVNGDNLHYLFEELAEDPEAAGWSLGRGVAHLAATADDTTGDFMPEITLSGGIRLGIGEPIGDEDIEQIEKQAQDFNGDGRPPSTHQLAHAALLHIAKRINDAY